MHWPTQSGVFPLGDLALQSGERIAGATLSWKTHGTLSPARDNVIVYPTSYGAQHPGLEWAIGPDSLFDPARWFIVIPDMFGNGLSSSPSNTAGYPGLVTSADNVLAQQRLLREVFDVNRVAAVYGFSMGAQQAYHWAALAPDAVARAIIVCGSARTSPHNQVFLLSLMAVLEAAPEHLGGGRFSAEPVAARRAFARNYAGWAMSQDWYRAGLHLSSTGAATLDAFLDDHWAPGFRLDAADLYAQLRTWYAGDISANGLYHGDLAAALGAIRARVLLMPGATDLYFPVADNADELQSLRSAELRPIPSIWGHIAGAPANIPRRLRLPARRGAGLARMMIPISPGIRRFIGNTLYETFEHVVMLVLTIVIVVLIGYATFHLVMKTFDLIRAGDLDPTDGDIYPSLFGMFFTVLIGLEFKRSFLIVTASQTSIVRIRSIILIGMLATLRKFIVLDLKEINVMEMLAVAAAILALGIVYWLVRDQETRSRLLTPGSSLLGADD